jgi:hypothetical protein
MGYGSTSFNVQSPTALSARTQLFPGAQTIFTPSGLNVPGVAKSSLFILSANELPAAL